MRCAICYGKDETNIDQPFVPALLYNHAADATLVLNRFTPVMWSDDIVEARYPDGAGGFVVPCSFTAVRQPTLGTHQETSDAILIMCHYAPGTRSNSSAASRPGKAAASQIPLFFSKSSKLSPCETDMTAGWDEDMDFDCRDTAWRCPLDTVDKGDKHKKNTPCYRNQQKGIKIAF